MASRHRLILPRFLWLLVGASLALDLGACGHAGTVGQERGHASLPGINTSLPATSERGTITTSAIPPGQSVRGDGDADNPGDIDGNGDIDSEDGDSDFPTTESYRFPDADDRPVFAGGHAPSSRRLATISALVERYYAAARRGDGRQACSLLLPSVARSAPEDLGGSAGPVYLRGSTSCAAVAEKLFAHSRGELSEAPKLFALRLDGEEAQVVMSSRKMRASDVRLTRQAGKWWLSELTGRPLP